MGRDWLAIWYGILQEHFLIEDAEMSKRGVLLVTPDLLKEALNLPDCGIYGAEWDFGRNCVKLYLKGGALPEVAEGCFVPEISVQYEKIFSKFV